MDQNEICTEVSLILTEAMRTLIRKLPFTKIKFYSEVKSETSLSSLRVLIALKSVDL